MVDPGSQMFSFDAPFSAILVGTSGGIGTALLAEATKGVAANTGGASGHVFAINRQKQSSQYDGVTSLTADALNEEQLAETVEAIKGDLKQNQFAPIRLILVAVGALHTSQGMGPEKSLRGITAHSMQEIFAANAVAPALAAKHFLPLLPKSGRTIFAALSARVGSISDNQLGGWYSYRASKSALNQILKTTSIELSRTRPDAICVGLHPGTVDTKLSKKFQANVPDGKLFSAEQSAGYLVQTLSRLTTENSGQVIAWDGTPVPA